MPAHASTACLALVLAAALGTTTACTDLSGPLGPDPQKDAPTSAAPPSGDRPATSETPSSRPTRPPTSSAPSPVPAGPVDRGDSTAAPGESTAGGPTPPAARPTRTREAAPPTRATAPPRPTPPAAPVPTARPTQAPVLGASRPRLRIGRNDVRVGGVTYRRQDPRRAWSVTDERGALRFEVRPGDGWSGDSHRPQVGRSELRSREGFENRRDIWISYSMRVEDPQADPGGWAVLGQFLARPDAGEGYHSPVLAVMLLNGKLALQSRFSTDRITGRTPSPTTRYWFSEYRPGAWVDIVMRSRFDPMGSGSLTLWVDGTKRVDEALRMGYLDADGPSWKFGLYGRDVPWTRAVTYANMETGYESLASRIAEPLPHP